MGRMAVEVEGGSTAPENVPQQRQDAQQFFALSQDPRSTARSCCSGGSS